MKQLVSGFSLICLFALQTQMAMAGDKDEVKATNLEKLNTAADEVDPFAVDNATLLYATNENGKFEIRLTKRTTAAAAAFPPGKVHRPYLSSKDYDCRSPFVWKGATLFFAQNKVPDKKFEGLRNFDVYQATGERAPVPLLVVNEQEEELFPWVSAGGKEFYFSRKTKEGWKLFVASGPGAGAAPGPIGKGTAVGFGDDFYHATLAVNGLTMYLQGPLEGGKTGIFRSKRPTLAGKWSEPEPIKALNTSTGKVGDLSPSLSPDGTRLYFVSDREGGKGGLDIWTVTVKDLK